jgi:tRNA1Val (adenine37-N6)-methyltransferase
VTDTHFKGWAKPGPIPPGAHADLQVAENETLDAISGHFRIFQLKRGHRFSTDDVLTAWYGTTWAPAAATILDLGSGIGSVGMIAAWRLAGARVVTIEAQAESVQLARKSAAYNGLSDRYHIRLGDFRDDRVLDAAERFDLVLGSPPYFPPGTGIEGDHPQKVACRFELRGDILDYARVASRHLSAGGLFACVFPEEQRRRVERRRPRHRPPPACRLSRRRAAAGHAVRHGACVGSACRDARAHLGRTGTRHPVGRRQRSS